MLLLTALRQATVWIDGRRDLTLNQVSLAAATIVTVNADLRFGGAVHKTRKRRQRRDIHVTFVTDSVRRTWTQ